MILGYVAQYRPVFDASQYKGSLILSYYGMRLFFRQRERWGGEDQQEE